MAPLRPCRHSTARTEERSAHPQAPSLLARGVGAHQQPGRRRDPDTTSSTDTTRLAAVGSSSRPSRMKGTPSTPNATTASALSPAPHRRESSTSRVPTNHGTGANASVAGTRASTTDAASRVTVAASSHGARPPRPASSAGASGVDGGHGVPARLGDERGRRPELGDGALGGPAAVRAGIARGVGEVVLDAGAQLGAAVLGQHRRLGLETGQPGPDLRLVQPARAAVARHGRHRSGPRGARRRTRRSPGTRRHRRAAAAGRMAP